MTAVQVDDWREVVVWVLLALPAIIGAVAGVRGLRRVQENGLRAEETANDLRVVRAQVENTHESNLRDDITALRTEVRDLTALVARVDDKASRIGEELRTENKLRREADARTNRKVARHHPEDAQ